MIFTKLYFWVVNKMGELIFMGWFVPAVIIGRWLLEEWLK
ncbi:hypothetical protein SB48_HM08orf06354 [Heyndrickxia coagulans]|uniref:Uncharacterized protein n=1 Tax=Heyndrickxia coagulans TaxID=1398 RepID=A0AAN0T9R9_HEYCO|nr:hypothetical protein SB48_HM08orf06354 [Heyndrickxia coagulans]